MDVAARRPVASLLCLALGLGLTASCNCGSSSPSGAALAPTMTAASVTAAPAASSAAPLCLQPGAARPRVVDLEHSSLTWREQSQAAAPADTSPAVEKACRQLAATGTRTVKQVTDPKGDVSFGSVARCFPGPTGAWALDVTSARALNADKDHPSAGWEVGVVLARVTPEGKLIAAENFGGFVSFREREHHDVSVVAVFDFDGDGVSEIVVEVSASAYGEEHEEQRSVWTFKGGKVVPYAPAANLKVVDVVDADGDGRPDLVTPGAFQVEGPCGYAGQEFTGPAQIAHSLPGGAFSLDDAVAQEVVRTQCGPMPRELIVVGHDEGKVTVDPLATARHITCARIYGMTAEDAARRLREQYPLPHNPDGSEPSEPSDPGYCMPLQRMLDLAGQAPDFTTTPPCSPPR